MPVIPAPRILHSREVEQPDRYTFWASVLVFRPYSLAIDPSSGPQAATRFSPGSSSLNSKRLLREGLVEFRHGD